MSLSLIGSTYNSSVLSLLFDNNTYMCSQLEPSTCVHPSIPLNGFHGSVVSFNCYNYVYGHMAVGYINTKLIK